MAEFQGRRVPVRPRRIDLPYLSRWCWREAGPGVAAANRDTMATDRPGLSDDDIDVDLQWPGAPTVEDPITRGAPVPPVTEVPPSPGEVDVDLGALRSELASLRDAVDGAGDLGQLRDLRATIDELREDVAALRQAVTEPPELEQVSREIAGLRAEVTDLAGGGSRGRGDGQGRGALARGAARPSRAAGAARGTGRGAAGGDGAAPSPGLPPRRCGRG